MSHRTRARISSAPIPGLGLLAFVGALAAPPAGATVVPERPEGCLMSEDLGEIEMLTDWITPDGESCGSGVRLRRLKAHSVSASWESGDIPMMVEVKRDRRGYRLILSSMLTDRRSRQLCWFDRPVPASGRGSPAKTWRWVEREFERWASNCSTTRAIGVAEARKNLAARRFDFERGLASLARMPAYRFGEPEDGTGAGSFHPSRITQRLLDAVADACEGPRERLRLLPGGAIDWAPDDSLPVGADGRLPFDSCVDRQILYFPGYSKRN
jgi:hypothetical protein